PRPLVLVDKSSWVRISSICFTLLQIESIRVGLHKVEPFLVAFNSQLKIFYSPLDDNAPVRLSMIEHLLEQLAELCSSHDPVMVVSLAGKTIQDAKRFEQLVDRRHLFQTLDVRVPPSDR
nr:hypothetical protein [Tanacetum cinerariifolium]